MTSIGTEEDVIKSTLIHNLNKIKIFSTSNRMNFLNMIRDICFKKNELQKIFFNVFNLKRFLIEF